MCQLQEQDARLWWPASHQCHDGLIKIGVVAKKLKEEPEGQTAYGRTEEERPTRASRAYRDCDCDEGNHRETVVLIIMILSQHKEFDALYFNDLATQTINVTVAECSESDMSVAKGYLLELAGRIHLYSLEQQRYEEWLRRHWACLHFFSLLVAAIERIHSFIHLRVTSLIMCISLADRCAMVSCEQLHDSVRSKPTKFGKAETCVGS
jgi:hypothetical protein